MQVNFEAKGVVLVVFVLVQCLLFATMSLGNGVHHWCLQDVETSEQLVALISGLALIC